MPCSSRRRYEGRGRRLWLRELSLGRSAQAVEQILAVVEGDQLERVQRNTGIGEREGAALASTSGKRKQGD